MLAIDHARLFQAPLAVLGKKFKEKTMQAVISKKKGKKIRKVFESAQYEIENTELPVRKENLIRSFTKQLSKSDDALDKKYQGSVQRAQIKVFNKLWETANKNKEVINRARKSHFNRVYDMLPKWDGKEMSTDLTFEMSEHKNLERMSIYKSIFASDAVTLFSLYTAHDYPALMLNSQPRMRKLLMDFLTEKLTERRMSDSYLCTNTSIAINPNYVGANGFLGSTPPLNDENYEILKALVRDGIERFKAKGRDDAIVTIHFKIVTHKFKTALRSATTAFNTLAHYSPIYTDESNESSAKDAIYEKKWKVMLSSQVEGEPMTYFAYGSGLTDIIARENAAQALIETINAIPSLEEKINVPKNALQLVNNSGSHATLGIVNVHKQSGRPHVSFDIVDHENWSNSKYAVQSDTRTFIFTNFIQRLLQEGERIGPTHFTTGIVFSKHSQVITVPWASMPKGRKRGMCWDKAMLSSMFMVKNNIRTALDLQAAMAKIDEYGDALSFLKQICMATMVVATSLIPPRLEL